MELFNAWVTNSSDMRPARLIFDVIIKKPDSVKSVYMISQIIFEQSNNKLQKIKTLELIKLLIKLPQISCGEELRIYKNSCIANHFIYNTIKKYGSPPDTQYFSSTFPRGHQISRL